MAAQSFPTPAERALHRVAALERRVRAFDGLSADEQRLLIASAVFTIPTPRTPIIDLCRALELKLDWQNLDLSRLTSLAERWKGLELVAWDGTNLHCEPDFAIYAIRYATASPTWKRPNDVGYMRAMGGLQRRASTEWALSAVRLMRLGGRDPDAGRLAASWLEGEKSVLRLAELFGPGDPWFVAKYVPNIEALLPARLANGLASLIDLAWYLELFEGLLSADPSSARLLLRQDAGELSQLRKAFNVRSLCAAPPARALWYLRQTLAGHSEQVRQRAEQEAGAGEASGLGYAAVVELVQGKLDSCVELFERASAGHKQKDLAPILRTWVGAFYVLALLVRGTEPDLVQAETLIRRIIGKGAKSVGCVVPYAHFWLAQHLQHLTGKALTNLRVIDHAFEHPGSYLIRLLVYAWNPTPELGIYANQVELKHVRQSARMLGHYWFERELLAIERRLANPRKPTAAAKSELGTLVDLVQYKEPWEQILDSLGRITTRSTTPKPEAEPPNKSNERLAWFVNEFSGLLYVEPRLQSRKGSGYGRGRQVALQRLLPPSDPTLPLTEADRAIIEHLQLQRFPYGRDEICFDDGVALALVGHPHVFEEQDDTVQFAVKRGQLQLRCEETKSGYLLRLMPSIAEAMAHAGPNLPCFVQIQGTDLMVYPVTAAIRDVAQMLGPQLAFPKTAESQIKALLPRLSALVPTTANMAADDTALALPGDATPVLRVRPKAEALRVQVLVTPFGPEGPAHPPGMGPEVLTDFRDGQTRQIRRQLATERQRAESLVEKLPSLDGSSADFVWTAPDLVSCLGLVSELSQLAEGDARVEWPEGQPLRLKRLRSMVVSIQGGDAAQWFEADGTLQFSDGAALRIATILGQLDRATGRFVRLSNGDYAELTRDALERLELLRSFQVDAGDPDQVRVAPWLALAMPKGDDSVNSEQGDAQWQAWRQRIEQINKRAIAPAKAFTGKLRDYQFEGFTWLCRMASLGTGVCLADDMGLGKTIQALALLQFRASRKASASDVTGPMLIVAPASVCPNWLSEAARFTPNLEPRWFTGADRTLEALSRKSLVVCTYEILHRDRDALAKITWDTLVLDEAHHIKNAHTRRARAAFALKAGFRLATTGTPIENHLGELWSLFHFLMPGLLGEQHDFVERFRSPIENARDQVRRQQLQALIRPFVLRRTKGQVLSELPPRTELVRLVQLSEPEVEFYEAIRQRGLEALRVQSKDGNQQRIRVLAELMRLRRACCHPRLVLDDSEIGSSKLAALLELVSELREAGHRALVFSQFVDHLSLVREALDDQGVSYLYLDGSTALAERARRVAAFQAGEGDLFLISLRAGGTGLNLTAADYVIHLDPWWNPAVEDQASDRAHRIGQERPVTIYRLVAQGTIEERLVAMHGEKRTLVADILEGTEGSKRLDPDDLMNLLRDAAMTRRATMRPTG